MNPWGKWNPPEVALSKLTVVVTGATGMLGADIVQGFQAAGYTVYGLNTAHCDLLWPEARIIQVMENLNPSLIIHSAAYTNVDACEENPELAMAINKDGTRKLAAAAHQLGVPLAYISTDYVFDGDTQTPYFTDAKPNPINTYGLSKYYGELVVRERLEAHYILRTSWLYGPHRRSFVEGCMAKAQQGLDILAFEDSFGTPSYCPSVAAMVLQAVTKKPYGIYHAVDTQAMSRYEQAVMICENMGLSAAHVQPTQMAALNLAARRPRYSVLDNRDLTGHSFQSGFHQLWEQLKMQQGTLTPSS